MDGRGAGWCLATPQYLASPRSEWGFPVGDDRRLFEKLCLEGFQAGLSWRTILEKRENFRAAFEGFDVDRIAAYGEADVARLLADAGIIRHRGKIEVDDQQRAAGAGARRRERVARRLCLELRAGGRGRARREVVATTPGIGRAVEGPEEARLALRRADDGLCLHAGDGARQRPRRGLRPQGRGRRGPRRLRPAGVTGGVTGTGGGDGRRDGRRRSRAGRRPCSPGRAAIWAGEGRRHYRGDDADRRSTGAAPRSRASR